jgi:hypothetical protein
MLQDLAKGQLTHTDPAAFEVGRNIAVTPGKVVKQTSLYQLIQYSPTTEQVLETPLIIFPPWINRYYILDLNPKKSFIQWAVGQGLTVFVVSWKSADESLKDVSLGDYGKAEAEAIDAVREALGVKGVHVIGYCVAGTALAATLALLAARGEADKVASATFFTAQVDFSEAGDLSFFLGDEQMELIRQLSADKGYLDGRGGDLQPAARPRPDLELRHQQLSARRGISAVRPALLEFRHDQPAGGLAPVLPPAALSRQQARPARRHQHRRHPDRPQEGQGADLCPGRPRGSYRAAAKRVEDQSPLHRADALRAGGLGSYRRRRQPASGGQISILDQRGEGRHTRPVRRRGDRAQGQLVARLDRLDRGDFGKEGAGQGRARARQGGA